MTTPETSLPARISRIVLVGFMGAGKSTVGAMLASQLKWPFFDADTELEIQAGSTIAEFFNRHGEAEFRRLEARVIDDLLAKDSLVLAVGGGAMETESTRKALLQAPETCVVFLEAPLEVMIARCEQQPGAAVRPVLADRARLRNRFESRLPHYRSAHLTIATDGLAPEAVAQRILLAAGLPSETDLKENASA